MNLLDIPYKSYVDVHDLAKALGHKGLLRALVDNYEVPGNGYLQTIYLEDGDEFLPEGLLNHKDDLIKLSKLLGTPGEIGVYIWW